jgi:hypothetical protein
MILSSPKKRKVKNDSSIKKKRGSFLAAPFIKDYSLIID